tara:strand:+ start:62 stop:220 length:159 start_codon:yes stop_codon:yes gene_type:complete
VEESQQKADLRDRTLLAGQLKHNVILRQERKLAQKELVGKKAKRNNYGKKSK